MIQWYELADGYPNDWFVAFDEPEELEEILVRLDIEDRPGECWLEAVSADGTVSFSPGEKSVGSNRPMRYMIALLSGYRDLLLLKDRVEALERYFLAPKDESTAGEYGVIGLSQVKECFSTYRAWLEEG